MQTLLCFIIFIVNAFYVIAASISGEITIIPPSYYKGNAPFILRINAVEVRATKDGNTPFTPSISQLFRHKPTQIKEKIIQLSPQKVHYTFSDLTINKFYLIYAYIIHESSQKYESPEFAFGLAGWFSAESHKGACNWVQAIKLVKNEITNINFEITGTTPYSVNNRKISSGKLSFIKGLPVLQLNGENRGFAHGYLIAEQIIDFFRYFVLQSQVGSCDDYNNLIVPRLMDNKTFGYTKEFRNEAIAIINGMKASGVNMYMKELGRNFDVSEIFAINGYLELEVLQSKKRSDESAACTQFSIWGDETKNGNLFAGRNMDGEIDLRRVTVSHLIAFAINPQRDDKKKYISIMWPGFIGTLSGINEDGLYVMMNCGSSHDNIVYKNTTLTPAIIYDILENTNIKEATPNVILNKIHRFNSQTGGACGSGCVFVFAKPSDYESPSSFIYEGDFKGGLIRVPMQAEPYLENAMVVSNHFHVYGVDMDIGSHVNFGKQVYYSSLWRFTAGNEKLKSYSRNNKGKGDVEMLVKLLQTAAHGTTEHSIIYFPSNGKIKFAISNAKMNFTGWDAPYLQFTEYEFNELF